VQPADLYSRQRNETPSVMRMLMSMLRLVRTSTFALLLIASCCAAQTAHKKAPPPPPKPEPTESDLVEYIRGQLLSLSPSDGINDNLEVRYDQTNKVLTVITPSGHCDMFITSLDPNNAVWDVFDPSDTTPPGTKLNSPATLAPAVVCEMSSVGAGPPKAANPT